MPQHGFHIILALGCLSVVAMLLLAAAEWLQALRNARLVELRLLEVSRDVLRLRKSLKRRPGRNNRLASSPRLTVGGTPATPA